MMVGVSVTGTVTSSVSGTAVGVSPVTVAVTVPSDVAVLVGVRGAGVFEGSTVLVVVGIRLEVEEGSGDGSAVGVDVATVTASGDGKPDPIKANRIPAKSRSVIPLKMIPPADGRILNTYRVMRPSTLASAKCARKTSKP